MSEDGQSLAASVLDVSDLLLEEPQAPRTRVAAIAAPTTLLIVVVRIDFCMTRIVHYAD
jgi:hypothetical protein